MAVAAAAVKVGLPGRTVPQLAGTVVAAVQGSPAGKTAMMGLRGVVGVKSTRTFG